MLNLEKYPYSASASTLNGATVIIQDGVITVDARNATRGASALSETRVSTADSIEAGTYYFGVDVYGSYESTPSTNVWQYKGNRTLSEKFIMKQWKFAVTQGNIASTPILISNDISKTNYEPYTGGQASPNPSYEQPIKNAGDNGSIIEKITNSDGTKEQTYTMPVQQPFRSIGDVRDCFVKVNGVWYERHYIGQVVLNGTENTLVVANSKQNSTYFENTNPIFESIATNIAPNALCNYLISKAANLMYATDIEGFTFSSSGNLRFNLLNTVATTVAELKTWLSTHNLIVDGILATPLDLPCTEEQINILENLPRTYKGVTHISSEDETPAELKIQYYKEG